MKTAKFHFAEAIATLISLAAVLGRNNMRYERLVNLLEEISEICLKWRSLPQEKEDIKFFSNEIDLPLDVTLGSLTLDEWKVILNELKNYVTATPVSRIGKFSRMTLFAKLHNALVLVASSSTSKKGWERPKKVYHDFSNFPKTN